MLDESALYAAIAHDEVVVECGTHLPVHGAEDNTARLVGFGAVVLDCVLPDGRRQVLALSHQGEMLSRPSMVLLPARLCHAYILENDGVADLERLTAVDHLSLIHI